MPVTSPAATAAKKAARLAMERLDNNGDLMPDDAGVDQAEIAPGQASPRGRESPPRSGSEKGSPKGAGKAAAAKTQAKALMKKPMGLIGLKGKGKPSPKATAAAATIMKKPSGKLGDGVIKKPAASEKGASNDASRVAPVESEAIVPLDPKQASTMRDIMKARKFQNLWDSGQLPDVVAERAEDIKKQKKGGKFRENMTELINNTFTRGADNKLVLATQSPYFKDMHNKSNSTGVHDVEEAVIWEVAKTRCGGEEDLRNAIRRGSVHAVSDAEFPNIVFPSGLIDKCRTVTKSNITSRARAIDDGFFEEFEKEMGIVMDDPHQAIAAGSAFDGNRKNSQAMCVCVWVPFIEGFAHAVGACQLQS